MPIVEHILTDTPADFSKMRNGDMITQTHGDNVVSYLKSQNQIYTFNWSKAQEVITEQNKNYIQSDEYKNNARGWRINDDGTSEFESVITRNSINSINWKFFQGTSAIKQRFVTIAHGIENGKKRIIVVSTNIASDTSPSASSGTIPTGSFLAGAGNIQDENDEDREFQTLYDDTNIYIFTDSTADDVASNQYTCAVFFVDRDLY